MPNDLRQQLPVITVVVHLAKVGCEHTRRLVPDLAWHASLTCVTRPDVEDFVRQIASADSLSFDERPAKHAVHIARHGLGVRRAALTHCERDDVGQDTAVYEQLAVFEVRRLHGQTRISIGVEGGLPNGRP
jgi:hypothetical protein